MQALHFKYCFFSSTYQHISHMRTIFFLFTCLFAFCAGAQKTPVADARFQGLDAAFAQVLKDWNAPGFAVAVVEKNKVIYAKGFGYRDMEKKLPVTTNTVFAIGSCTKAFTSSVIGLLQKEGKVDFDKPAHDYLSSLRFYNNDMNNTITLRDMMSHRTGLPRHDFSWYFFNTTSRDSFLQRVQYQEPTARVRDRWQYNNFMFLAQGVIAEKLTGASWEQNVTDRIFRPLGMTASNFSIRELERSNDAALGYDLRRDTVIYKLPYYNIDAMGPAGSINSNVMDMSKWLITWIYGGKYEGKEILPGNYFTEAITPQAIIGAGLPSKEKPDVHFSAYGFGWMLSSYRGHYRVEHGGNIDGFSATTAFFPTDSIGIVVLVNQNASRVPAIIRNMLADRMLKLTPYNWHTDAIRDAFKAKMSAAATRNIKKTYGNTKPTHPLKDFAGTYLEPGYGPLKIWERNDSLFANMGQHLMWLKHDNFNVFDFFRVTEGEPIDTAEIGPIRLQFLLSKSGELDRVTMDFEPGIKPLEFKRQLETKEVSTASLKNYVGDYDLGNITIKVYIKNDKTLYALVPGQPEYELLPTGKDKFALKVLSGYFVQFDVAPDGKVTALTFIQPNGNFKATRK